MDFFQAFSVSASSTEKSDAEVQDEKSEIYSNNMTQTMGAGKVTTFYSHTASSYSKEISKIFLFRTMFIINGIF